MADKTNLLHPLPTPKLHDPLEKHQTTNLRIYRQQKPPRTKYGELSAGDGVYQLSGVV
jgi:hypothetical protein